MRKRIRFTESNKSQQYATHGYFRYFGKLPPVATRHILEKCVAKSELVVDLMSGSGTTLVEAQILGFDSIGIEVNPLSVLISQVKTRSVKVKSVLRAMEVVISHSIADLEKVHSEKPFESDLEYLSPERPSIVNKQAWFEEYAEATLIVLRHHIRDIKNSEVRDFLTVAFLSLIRKVSNASVRTGRIFRKNEVSNENALELFEKKVISMCGGMEEYVSLLKKASAQIINSDARHTGLKAGLAGFVINHPPYFALYKYSSDVLRFELAWAGFDRKTIVEGEIRDGFKTTKVSDFDLYLQDMTEIFVEAYRILKKKRKFCIVVSDSTLNEEQLPVVNSFIRVCKKIGFKYIDHEIREVAFTQAKYHRSANRNILTKEDHLIYFEK